MKKPELIKLLSSWLLFAGCLMLMALPDAWAGCMKGDEKCSPDGYVLVCEKNIYTDEMEWKRNVFRKCDAGGDAGGACVEGDTKCGADGNVLKCKRDLYTGRLGWTADLAGIGALGIEKCGSAIVCEPGIRRCRAGKVQVCDYAGERWDTEYGEKCDSHDISED